MQQGIQHNLVFISEKSMEKDLLCAHMLLNSELFRNYSMLEQLLQFCLFLCILLVYSFITYSVAQGSLELIMV